MKKADIQIGEEYAAGSKRYPARIRVLEFGTFEKRVYSGERWDYAGHLAKMPGVKAERLDQHTGEPQDIKWYSTREVLEPWANRVAATKASVDLQNQRKAEAEELIAEFEEVFGIRLDFGWMEQHHATSLTREQIRDILKRVSS